MTTARARTKEEAGAPEDLLGLLREMMLIRRFEEKAAEMYARGRIAGFLHLYIGQEAVGVGAISAIGPEDYVVSHYRDHGQALARGLDPKAVMAELFGRTTGVSKGRGGSMHLFDVSKHFMGGYAIVGGHLPLSCGLAMASKHLKNNRIVLCFFGDGAVNEGEFHEALNLAAIWSPARHLALREQLLRHGHGYPPRLRRDRGLPSRLRLQHQSRAGRRHGRAGGSGCR